MISTTAIEGLIVIERPTHSDSRGFFREPFRLNEVEVAVGHSVNFVQQNHARSRQGVLRGLHAEGWEKLVYVPHGQVFTAIADIRPESPSFGKVATLELGGDGARCLYLPKGLAHGYYVMSDEADYMYLVTKYYDGSDTCGVLWNDPDLAVPWPTVSPVLSDRDRGNPTLRQLLGSNADSPLRLK